MKNVRESFEVTQGQFDNWVDMWEKAQASGVFDNAPKPACPSRQTADVSFFGASEANPTEGPSDFDAQYWNQIYSLSNGEEPEMLHEDRNPNPHQPNPVDVASFGTDQDMKPAPLGMTFDEEDLKKLEGMKMQLHELGDKLAGAMGKGDNFKKFETKIASLTKQIDELSSSMTRPYPAKK